MAHITKAKTVQVLLFLDHGKVVMSSLTSRFMSRSQARSSCAAILVTLGMWRHHVDVCTENDAILFVLDAVDSLDWSSICALAHCVDIPVNFVRGGHDDVREESGQPQDASVCMSFVSKT